jgi:hypothetical protein
MIEDLSISGTQRNAVIKSESYMNMALLYPSSEYLSNPSKKMSEKMYF